MSLFMSSACIALYSVIFPFSNSVLARGGLKVGTA